MTESPQPGLRFLLSSPAAFLALGAGAGLVPKAPGTAGSLLAVPLVWLLQELPFGWQIAVWVALCGLGVWLCERVGKALGEPDHGAIVWDEICGQAIVLLLVPVGLGWIVVGFVAFRFFDIVKPWPIHIVDKHTTGGVGAMGDDLMAAGYAIVSILVARELVAASGV